MRTSRLLFSTSTSLERLNDVYCFGGPSTSVAWGSRSLRHWLKLFGTSVLVHVRKQINLKAFVIF
jgi:hypothetical protein